ncbi:uncharacterized protein LOC129598434 [Paramacrobiotus metropolitanus]|uniref:uncharacterized protein LOC129598434 n=1 Tax=Paramacrobiotus metropolitanus TaxID=2943436 RepID=UPI002445E361|nr:uncharacterized protein LOC129598434 [Paramacrobiotus metropolitanus]XP_055352309.1 uncharacterized protein LOC129598434 [Paramacrobiotus metropolitanus]XP_055352310.1 uncharacterized protein LOC129598434 [Paramacrobiotus metropolitanus]
MDYHHKGDLASILKDGLRAEWLLNSYASLYRFTEDITHGLEFLHGKGIIHGDLKPQNILLNALQRGSERLVIGDLDDLVQIKENATCSGDISQLRGTARYMSPEMLRKFWGLEPEPPGRKTDIWSLGCIILEMVETFERVPKQRLAKNGDVVDAGSQLTNYQYSTLIVDGYVPFVSNDIDKNLTGIIRECLDIVSGTRISANKLLQRLRNKSVIVLLESGGYAISSQKFWIFDPLTHSAKVEEVFHEPTAYDFKRTGYQPPLIAAAGGSILFIVKVLDEDNGTGSKAIFHFWNVGKKEWYTCVPVHSVNTQQHLPISSAVIPCR